MSSQRPPCGFWPVSVSATGNLIAPAARFILPAPSAVPYLAPSRPRHESRVDLPSSASRCSLPSCLPRAPSGPGAAWATAPQPCWQNPASLPPFWRQSAIYWSQARPWSQSPPGRTGSGSPRLRLLALRERAYNGIPVRCQCALWV